MIDVWSKPLRYKAVLWTGDNEAEIKEFIESFDERNVIYRIVDGQLQYMNDFAFPPNDTGRGADGYDFVYNCPVGNWLVRGWDRLCEEQYALDMNPGELTETYLMRKPE